jgi:hypothetical protein
VNPWVGLGICRFWWVLFWLRGDGEGDGAVDEVEGAALFGGGFGEFVDFDVASSTPATMCAGLSGLRSTQSQSSAQLASRGAQLVQQAPAPSPTPDAKWWSGARRSTAQPPRRQTASAAPPFRRGRAGRSRPRLRRNENIGMLIRPRSSGKRRRVYDHRSVGRTIEASAEAAAQRGHGCPRVRRGM